MADEELDPRAQALMPMISPTRAYWAGALRDLGNIGRQAPQGWGAQAMAENQMQRAKAYEYNQQLQAQPELTTMLGPNGNLISFDPRNPGGTVQTVVQGSGPRPGTRPTASIQEVQQYQQMLELGDPNAEAYGRKIGMVPDADSAAAPVGAPQRMQNGNLGLVLSDGTIQDTGTRFHDPALAEYTNKIAEQADQLYMEAYQMGNFANRFDAAAPEMNAGVAGWAEEGLKSIFGGEDAVTQLRTNYNQFKNSAVMQALPPGPASDVDVANAMKGFPSDTDSPAYISSWLRGQQKIKRAEGMLREHQAEFYQRGGKRGDWPEEMERFLESLSGTVFQPADPNAPPAGFDPI